MKGGLGGFGGDGVGEVADFFDGDGDGSRRVGEVSRGFMPVPTPEGVPVRMTVPGRRVVEPERKAMRVGTSKIMSAVLESCMVWPLRMVRMRSALGLGISSRVTMAGPRGQKVSKVLPRRPLGAAPVFSASLGRRRRCRRCSRGRSRGHFFGDVFGTFADDDGEFAFVIDLRAGEMGGDFDGVAGVLQGGDVLHEEDWEFGDGGSDLLGMFAGSSSRCRGWRWGRWGRGAF